MKNRSDIFAIFPKFKVLIENYFKKSIVSVYSTNGGEYQKLKSFFESHVITHLTTPPHTSQHNGVTQR